MPVDKDFEFDIWGDVLNYGNRTDRELNEDDEWYSWDAAQITPITAVITVYGDTIPTQKYIIGWTKVSE